MNHVFHLFAKFIVTGLVMYGVLGFLYGVAPGHVLLVTVLLVILGYLSDVFLMPRMGNVFASLTDFLICFTLVWLLGTYLFDPDIGPQLYKANRMPLFQAALVSAAVFTVIEWFYHKWFRRQMGRDEFFA
ncbi:DUF2512 family protein [Staphylospora marina]|uniref:DUF2512 family protein n=1 Tax=Staphylospora marina TaxID=2490858 RepID=UPI000F5BA5B3|nr:DUF2512 family protein [Staphylospora marina]